LLESVPENLIVVVDEAYFDYVQEAEYPNSMEWLPDFQNLLVTRTFSKAYGLAGFRIGYGVAHRDLADLLNRVRQPFNINSLALSCAEAALSDREHMQKTVRNNQAGMKYLTESFTRMGLEY